MCFETSQENRADWILLITSFVARCLHCAKAILLNLSFCQSGGYRRAEHGGCADGRTGFHCALAAFLWESVRSCLQAPRNRTRLANFSINPRFISSLKITKDTLKSVSKLVIRIGTQGTNVVSNQAFLTLKKLNYLVTVPAFPKVLHLSLRSRCRHTDLLISPQLTNLSPIPINLYYKLLKSPLQVLRRY